ncbi:MAG: CPBP family intramembrane metalloprotease [Clostridium sp.]|nr:CPBP family intramembrane metalloprotease [Clostridium sp.]
MDIRGLFPRHSRWTLGVEMVVVFLAIQLGCTLLASQLSGGVPFFELPSSRTAFWMAASSVITVFCFYFLSWIGKADFGRGDWSCRGYLLAAGWMITAILPVNLLVEVLEIDNAFEKQFIAWMHTPWGVLNIVLLAPLAEEVVFRAGVIGALRRSGCRGNAAVVVSALLFGVVHGNWAQGIVAFLLGLMLGFIYLRGRSIWPAWMAHVINNAVGVLTALSGSSQSSLTEIMGGRGMAIAASLISLCLFVFVFRKLNVSSLPCK